MTPFPREDAIKYLDIAWNHLGQASGDLDLPDLIAYDDISHDWPSLRSSLVQKIETGSCHLSHVEVVDLPKDRLMVRPLARMRPEDRLIYDAAIFAMADYIESAIPSAVHSYRWWKREKRLLGPGGRWIEMQRQARDLHSEQPDLLLARTDIAAFYEHIDIGILIDDLSALSGPSWAVDTIEDLLRSFNDLSNAWGIPQGSDASGLLANLYLKPLDTEIIRGKFQHFRYSDDVYIFGSDWISLRQVLLEANRTLRHRHLNLSSAKTKIVESEDVEREFEDIEKDAILYGLSIDSPDSIHELHALFNAAVKRDPTNVRDLKFCLTQLGKRVDDHAVDWLLGNMGEVPHAAREALIYLRKFPQTDSNLDNFVVDLLGNRKLVLYPYAEQHLLIDLICRGVRSDRAIETAWHLLLDKNKESFVREFAARYIGMNAPPASASRLKQEFQLEANIRVRRALLVACYESRQCSDKWLGTVSRSLPELSLTTEYLKSHPDCIPVPRTGKWT